MATLLLVFGGLLYLVGFVCSLIILIEAFREEIWKGLVSILIWPYFLYYALIDFDHEYRWPIVGGSIGGGLLGTILVQAAEGMLPH